MSEEVKSVSIKRMKEALRHALDKADPNLAQYPEIKRARINWPMKPFTDELKKVVTEFKQFRSVVFEFTEEQIKSQLTTCILKTETFRLRLSFDYKTGTVSCFCVGKDFDGMAEDFSVTKLVETVREIMPKKKVVIIKRKPKATV